MTIKEAISTVSYELGELTCISDEAYEALDYLEEHSDVEEVIRCKDCDHCKPWMRQKTQVLFCHYHGREVWGDDFCSRGKRKEVPDGVQ